MVGPIKHRMDYLLHNHLHHLLHEFCSWGAEDDYGDEWDSGPSSELLHELPGNGSPPHIFNEGEAVSQVSEGLKVGSSQQVFRRSCGRMDPFSIK